MIDDYKTCRIDTIEWITILNSCADFNPLPKDYG